MSTKSWTLLLTILLCSPLFSQLKYGHEWIDPTQPHIKVAIVQENLYRISATAIKSINPLIAANPLQICLFNNGIPVPLYVSWTGSNPGDNDYIEFWGKARDGAVDAKLYSDSTHILNPYTSMLVDTNYYFITLRATALSRISNQSIDTVLATSLSPYCIASSILSLRSGYETGRRYYYNSLNYVHSPAYELGEGWGGSINVSSNMALNTPINLSTPGALNIPGVRANLSFNIFARNQATHRLKVLASDNQILDTSFTGSTLLRYHNQLPSSMIVNGTTTLRVIQQVANSQGYALGYAKIDYARDFNLSGSGNFQINLPPSSNIQKFRVSGFDHQSAPIVVYNLNTLSRQIIDPNSNFTIAASASNTPIPFLIVKSSSIATPINLKSVVFPPILSNSGDLVIITHPNVRYDAQGVDIAAEYALYKQTPEGGNHRVVTVNIDDIENWMGYGHYRHPLAIRKFLQYAYHHWNINGRDGSVFIVGKGLPNLNIRSHSALDRTKHLIPPFGFEEADYLYATEDTSQLAFWSVGRLACTEAAQFRNYLSKVRAYHKSYYESGGNFQTPALKSYLKRVVHLSGGLDNAQKILYRDYLKEFENLIIGPNIGASMYVLSKAGRDQIPTENSLDLESHINNGVGLITFFGHSSASVLDIGISDPENFRNVGKYPIFLANGCAAGDIYTTDISYSEQFVNGVNKGAIAFLAASGSALDGALHTFSRNFYDHINQTSYNQTIGQISRNTTRQVLTNAMGQFNIHTATALEFVLHGDPTLPMPYYPQPDYHIDASSVSISPQIASVSTDSATVRVIVHNLGRAIDTQITIQIIRTGNSIEKSLFFTVKAPYLLDTYDISIPVLDPDIGLGVQKIGIKIDYNDLVAEISESNNQILNFLNFTVLDLDAIPIYPTPFAIEGGDSVTLYATGLSDGQKSLSYWMQIDTTELFSSPTFRSVTLQSTDHQLIWTPNINWYDSTVYYWRVGVDSSSSGRPTIWNGRSFLFTKPYKLGGWNQSHYDQWFYNQFSNFYLDTDRVFKYRNQSRKYEFYTSSGSSTTSAQWFLDGVRMADYREQRRVPSGLVVVWQKASSGLVMSSIDTIISNRVWGSEGSVQGQQFGVERYAFVFPDTGVTPSQHIYPNTPWTQVIENLLNKIPNGDYIYIYSLGRPNYTQWSASLVQNLRNLGLSTVDSLKSGMAAGPLIFAAKKSDASFTPIVNVGLDYNSTIKSEFTITAPSWLMAQMRSPKIGKAKQWSRIQYELVSLESPSTDSAQVDLIGYDILGAPKVLRTYYPSKVDENIIDIDAQQYPYLELRLSFYDRLNRTPPQIKYWRVLYLEDLAELMVSTKPNYSLIDTITVGLIQPFAFSVSNIGNRDIDSVNVLVSLQNGKQWTQTITNLPAKSHRVVSLDIGPQDYAIGPNVLNVELNPQSSPRFIEEQTYLNNILIDTFWVEKDTKNPLLDVTFDGIRILNNELVSAEPNVIIKLIDENKALLLNDTSLFTLWVKRPDGSTNPIFFASPNVRFVPAPISKKNEAQIYWNPSLSDGHYELIVKDRDRSGNSSGNLSQWDYKIGFKVMTKMTASQLLAYPNPFSTATHFVFTLTGSKIPDRIQIQILNIKGQVVKTIQKEALGPLRIGLNKTQYTWDGRDDYGDLLANGVYLYRVDISDQGKAIETMNFDDFKNITGQKKDLSQYFNHQFGKIVILR